MDLPASELKIRQLVRAASGESYRVIDRLGSGGNANVFLVEAITGPHRGVLFALKLFREITKEPRLGRFKREAKFLHDCDHPTVMRVYDGGEIRIEGSDPPAAFPYMIVEYLPKTLTAAFRSGLTMAEKLSCTLQLLSALEFLTSCRPQVVHRDIKPENIFVRGRACVLGDFGLMKLLGENEQADAEHLIESAGVRLPKYFRTPDLLLYCRGEANLTVQSDVFQLGLVLAVLFSGFNPLVPAERLLDDVHLHKIEVRHGSLSGVIEDILNRMLDFDPSKRPTASELLEIWEGPFLEAVNLSHKLEGKFF